MKGNNIVLISLIKASVSILIIDYSLISSYTRIIKLVRL